MTRYKPRQSMNSLGVKLMLVGILAIFMLNLVSASFPSYLKSSQVGCYPLDETSGNAINYAPGQLNNGTVMSGTRNVGSQWSTLGKAYYFDMSTSQNVTIPSSASLNLSDNFTIGVAFNSSIISTSYAFGKGGITAPRSYWMTQNGGLNTATRVSIHNVTDNQNADSTMNATGRMIYAIASYNGTHLNLYINGTLDTSTPVTGPLQKNTYDFYIGHILGGDTTAGSYSYISEVWILNNSINATTASLIWNGSAVTTCIIVPTDVTVDLFSPDDNANSSSTTNYFVSNVTNITAAIKNVSLYINGTLNQTNTSQLNGTYNFSVNLPSGTWTWYVVSYDTNNFEGTSSTRTLGRTDVVYGNSEYNAFMIEQSSTTFKQNFSINSDFSISSVNFTYNQTNYTASFTSVNSTTYQATYTLTTPSVTASINKSFNWTVFLTDGNDYTSSTLQQQVTNFGVDNCSVNTIMIFNFTIQNERTQVNLTNSTDNTSIKINLNLYPNASLITPTITFSYDYNQTHPAKVCVSSALGSSIFYTNLQAEYSATSYEKEFYNIQNYSLNATSNPSQNITLFDLATAESTPYTITYKDASFLPVAGALIQVQRKYIDEGVFKTVEIPITDASGQAVAHLVTNDAIYTFTVVKNGQILATFTSQNAICQNPTITDCAINLNSFLSSIDISDFATKLDFSYSLGYNSSSRTVSSTFTIPSGAVSWVSLNVTQANALETSVCNTAVTTSAGTLNCVIGSSFGNSTVTARIYKDGTLVSERSFKLDQTPSDIYGASLVLLALFLLITLIGASLSDSPVFTIIFFMVGVILLFALNLVGNHGFGPGATILWLIVAIVIVIIKGANRT